MRASESLANSIGLEICQAAQRAVDLLAYRQSVLGLVQRAVPFDVGVFHEFSPRVALSRAALQGVEREVIEAGRGSWDENAVLFGRLRELAFVNDGVASDREAFARDTRGRAAWQQRVCKPLRVQTGLVAHVMLRERLLSALLLARRRDRPFDEREQACLKQLLPAIAIGEGLHKLLTDATPAPAGPIVRLRCVDQRLTPRQREIVEHVALGQTNLQIAVALGVSANTVRNLLTEVRARLGAGNRAEVVHLAVLR